MGCAVMIRRAQHRKGPRRPERAAVRWAGLTAGLVVLVGLATVSVWATTGQSCSARISRGTPAGTVVAAVPYWSLGSGTDEMLGHESQVTEFSPWIYGLAANGRIVPTYPGAQADRVGSALDRACDAGIPTTPTLANYRDGDFSYQPIGRILGDPTRMRRHADDIAAFVRDRGFAGIDIDYEDLRPGDRAPFSAFVARLADKLHADGKLLSVALFAKTDDAGPDPRNRAQDYAAIGRYADEVRLMGYDYHWSTSPAGPVAPVSWLRAVLAYATTQIPAGKLVLGVPLYGYDWTGDHGTPISWRQARDLAARYGAKPRYDGRSSGSTFGYTDAAGHRHRVWFETARGTRAKLELAAAAHLGGVYLWMFGPSDPATWTALERSRPPGHATGNR